jgi:hypothetical protein
MDSAAVEARMNPDHLTVDDLAEEVRETADVVTKPPEKHPEADPKAQREYTWDFEWTDGRGKVWKGSFTNRVPDIRTRQLIGALRAQCSNNMPVESLDGMTQEMNLVLAHLTFSLVKRPKWADDLSGLFDFQLLQALYTEVVEHEGTFLGYGEAPATS